MSDISITIENTIDSELAQKQKSDSEQQPMKNNSQQDTGFCTFFNNGWIQIIFGIMVVVVFIAVTIVSVKKNSFDLSIIFEKDDTMERNLYKTAGKTITYYRRYVIQTRSCYKENKKPKDLGSMWYKRKGKVDMTREECNEVCKSHDWYHNCYIWYLTEPRTGPHNEEHFRWCYAWYGNYWELDDVPNLGDNEGSYVGNDC